jgi:hypothetical protein
MMVLNKLIQYPKMRCVISTWTYPLNLAGFRKYTFIKVKAVRQLTDGLFLSNSNTIPYILLAITLYFLKMSGCIAL